VQNDRQYAFKYSMYIWINNIIVTYCKKEFEKKKQPKNRSAYINSSPYNPKHLDIFDGHTLCQEKKYESFNMYAKEIKRSSI
jgi:hypothetical protein